MVVAKLIQIFRGMRGTGIKVTRRSVAETTRERRSAAINRERSNIGSTIEERSVASTVEERRSFTSTIEERRDAWCMGNCASCVTLAVELKLPL